MELKSFELFSKEHAASEKFDYFMCSVAGALFAYIGQNYTPHKLDGWPYYLTPAALLCLTLSFAFGLWIICLSKKVTRMNKEVLLRIEENVAIQEGLNKGWSSLTDLKTAQTITREQANALIKQNVTDAEMLREAAMADINFADTVELFRNWLLALTFLLILAEKVFKPYFE